MNTKPLEADTRLLINNSLTNLGWNLKKDKNQNVWVEQPKTEAERKKLGGKHPDYMLYSKKSDSPLIVIEAKKPGERIDKALEQGIDYARILNAPLVFATDGVFCKSFHTVGNTTPKLNGEDVDEFLREVTALRFLNEWNVNTVSPRVQYDRKELIRIFDEANNMLRGDGLRAGIERFGEFANILFLKLISESEQIKRESGIQSKFDASCSWDTIKNTPSSARIEYANNMVYKKLNDLYGTEIFTPLTIRDNTILKEIMDKLDPLTLTDVDSDIKGDAFEFFLRASTATKNDLGEYFTPRHIVKTMVRLVNPQFGEKIYDPFCGTGGFLIETFRYIDDKMPRNPANKKILSKETIYGNEITNTARITKMNMILAGDGHSNIEMKDSLANPVDGKYDIVLANMPYSQKTKHSGLYDLPTTNGDSICVQHCMRAINATADNGRMALVVPEGFLFRKDLAKTREYLLERAQLQSIISLPQGVFLPYTGVKTNIIFATKVNQKLKSSEKRKDYWYFEVKSDGLTLDNNRRKLDTPSDLTKYEEYRKLDSDQKDEMLRVGFECIPLNTVRENSFILVGNRYRVATTKNTSFSLVGLGDEKYFTILSGGTPSSNLPEYWDGNINWITLADLPVENHVTHIYKTERTITTEGLNKSAAKLLPINTVVVSSRATIGRVGIAKTELATNQGFKNIVIKDFSLVLPEYLAYVLTAKKHDMLSLARGGTFNEISKENISTIQIPLPPFDVQKQIVDEIEGYQQIVDSARNITEKYKPIVKVNPQWETTNVSELFTAVSEIIDPQVGSGTVAYIGLENIEADTGVLVGNVNVDKKTIKSAKRTFNKGDILYGKLRPNLNKVWHAEFDGICSTDMIVLRPKNSEVLAKFYTFLLRDKSFNAMVLNGVSGGQLPRVDVHYFLALPLQKISLQEQRQIIAQIEVEQALIEPSRQLIEVFTKKMRDRIKEICGE